MKTSHSKKGNNMKMKIRRGKKLKWNNRRQEQNMRFEVNYNIKTGDLICTKLKDMK